MGTSKDRFMLCRRSHGFSCVLYAHAYMSRSYFHAEKLLGIRGNSIAPLVEKQYVNSLMPAARGLRQSMTSLNVVYVYHIEFN